MATPTLTSAFFRRIARLGSTKASSKGELLASVSALWFLIFLLVPILIVVFFGFTTVNQDLTISYSRLTGANYLGALDPFGPVATLFVRTLGVAFLAAVGSLAVAFPIAYYLARVCRERNRGLLVSLFVIPFWISFVVQVYAVLPWVRRDGYVGMVLDRIGLGSLADWIFKAVGLGSQGIVVPVLIYIWLPFMILPLFTAILRIDPALLEAAQARGAGSWKTFWNVVVPLSYSGILTGTILVFITAFGSFVEPKILAGSSVLLIGNYIQASFLEFGKLPDGAAASVVVLVPTIALLYVYVAYAQAPATGLARESVVARIVRAAWGRLSALLALLALLPIARKKTDTGSAPGGPDPTRTIRVYRSRPEQLFDSLASWRGPGILRAYTFVALAAFYIPLIQVIIFSFNHDNNTIVWSYPSLRWYVSPPGYQEVSSLFGDTAMIGALSNSIGIGLVVTAISLAIGLPAALAIVRYRFSSKPFLNLMPGIVSAALLAFTFSFSEVVVTLFLTGAGIQTLPILFWAQLSKQIQTPELNAASTLIIGLSIVFIVLSNKVQRGGTLFRF